jgi:hypothetical protein
MAWLGSDDLLLAGTLATVAFIFDQLLDVQWVTGGNEAGDSFTPYPNVVHIRSELAAGKYDGRSRGFVMQEGTFWRAELSNKVGGVDRRFKLAGDWDLWRRFAQHTPLYSVTFPLARFTRRKGQKSEDMSSYYREVDGSAPLSEVADKSAYRLVRYPWGSEWQVEREEHSTQVA